MPELGDDAEGRELTPEEAARALRSKAARVRVDKDGNEWRQWARPGCRPREILIRRECARTKVPRCYAILSSGKQCKNPAVVGSRVCKFHGGMTPSPGGVSKRQGREATTHRRAFEAEVRNLRKNPELFRNCVYEIELLTAIIEKIRAQEGAEEKILARPGNVVAMLGELARIKKVVNEILHNVRFTFTIDEVKAAFQGFHRIVTTRVRDEATLREIAKDMRRLAQGVALRQGEYDPSKRWGGPRKPGDSGGV